MAEYANDHGHVRLDPILHIGQLLIYVVCVFVPHPVVSGCHHNDAACPYRCTVMRPAGGSYQPTVGTVVHGLDRNRAARQFALVQSVRGLFAGSLALRKLTIAPERHAVNIRGLADERAVDIDNRIFLNPLVTHHHGNLRAAEPINGNTLKERLLK